MGRERWAMGEKVTGNKKQNRQAQNRQGEVKNSIGNEKGKEFIYATNGHEVSGGGECWRVAGRREEGDKGDNKLGQL